MKPVWVELGDAARIIWQQRADEGTMWRSFAKLGMAAAIPFVAISLARICTRALLPGTLYLCGWNSKFLFFSAVGVLWLIMGLRGWVRGDEPSRYNQPFGSIMLGLGFLIYFPYNMHLEYVQVTDRDFSFSSGVPLLAEAGSVSFQDMERIYIANHQEYSGTWWSKGSWWTWSTLSIDMKDRTTRSFYLTSSLESAWPDIRQRARRFGVSRSPYGFDFEDLTLPKGDSKAR